MTQFILEMWSCEQSLVTKAFLLEKLSYEKLQQYMVNMLKHKVRKLQGHISAFREVTGENLVVIGASHYRE